MKLIILLMAIICSGISSAQIVGVDYQWVEKKDEEGIKVYTSKVPGSKFKAVRAEMLIDAQLNSLVGLVSDSDACPKWADLCKEEKVIEQLSPTESYVYTYNDIPFPVSDRDVLAYVVWEYNDKENKVTMTSTATTGRMEKTKAVRIEKAVAHWHFTQLTGGKVQVENFAHIDPNGPTPAWLTNLLLVSSPFITMKNMRKLIQSGKYDDAKVDFLP